MKNKKALDPEQTETLRVRVEGVDIVVRVDGEGRPLYAVPASAMWSTPEQVSKVRLALFRAVEILGLAAEQAQRKVSSDKAAEASAEKRAPPAFVNYFLARAYDELPHDDCGRTRLLQRARQLFATAKDAWTRDVPADQAKALAAASAAMLDQITEDRARDFLGKIRGRAPARPRISSVAP